VVLRLRVFRAAQYISNWRSGLASFILCISNWISCKGPPCVGIGNKLGEYPSSIGSVVFSYLRCENVLPLELHSCV